MLRNKYGTFSYNQFAEIKQAIRKRIFYLLLIVDKNTKDQFEEEDLDVLKAFRTTMRVIDGFNSLLFYPPEIVKIMALLEAARMEYINPTFDFSVYRKLILDAGAEVMNIEGEVDDAYP